MWSTDCIVSFLQSHTAALCFAGAFLGGTSLTLVLCAVAGQGLIDIWQVAVFAFLGNLAADSVWFAIGHAGLFRAVTSAQNFSRPYQRVQRLMQKFSGRRFLVFVLVKFVYGVRILSILYFGRIRYDMRRFLAFDAVAVFIITGIVSLAGWTVGKSAGVFLDALNRVEIGVTAGALLLVLYQVARFMAQRVSWAGKGEMKSC